jgi:putative inorganic carbon (hco3(-)) transporter
LIGSLFSFNPDNPAKITLLKVSWLFTAILVGLFISTQPISVVIIIGTVFVFMGLATISPMTTIMVVLILAPMRTLIATEAPLQLPLDIGQFALMGLLISWAVQRIARGERLITRFWSPVSIIIFLYIVTIGLSALNAISLSAWLNEWLKWIQILILVIFVLHYGGDRRWEWLVFGLTVSGIANAAIGIYEFFGGSGALHLLIGGRFFRAFGTFGQPNPFGGFMGIITPVAIMAALGYSKRAWDRWQASRQVLSIRLDLLLAIFYAASALTMTIAIGMSWSRGAWIGLGSALAIMAFALPRNTWKGVALFGSILGILFLLWFTGALPRSIVDRLGNSTQEFFAFEDVRGVDINPENYAVAERLAHWQAALNMATEHPLLGVGLGNYEIAYPTYRLINWYEPLGHAHNYYLNILAEAGIVGFLGYCMVWSAIIILSWQGRKHPDILARFVTIGLLGTWIYLTIHSLFDNLYVNNLFLHMGLMLGILAVLYNQMRTHVRLGIS